MLVCDGVVGNILRTGHNYKPPYVILSRFLEDTINDDSDATASSATDAWPRWPTWEPLRQFVGRDRSSINPTHSKFGTLEN